MAAPSVYNPLLGPPPKVTPEDCLPKPAAPQPPAVPKTAQEIISQLPQPGNYEQLHMEVRTMMAQMYAIDGARVVVSKPISNNFQVTHNIQMGKTSTYNFGTTFIGDPKFGGPEYASPLLMSDIDGKGNMLGKVIHWINPNMLTKFTYQYSADQSADMVQLEADYKGKDFTASVKVQNPDIVNESGTWAASYLQSITKNLAMGGELVYQYHQGLQSAEISLATRYKGDQGTVTGTISQGGEYMLSYGHNVNEKIMLGTEMSGNLFTKDAQCSVGYQFDLRQNAVRGQVNSRGVIIGILENKLAPGLTFTITGQVNHFTGLSVFGIGFMLGQ